MPQNNKRPIPPPSVAERLAWIGVGIIGIVIAVKNQENKKKRAASQPKEPQRAKPMPVLKPNPPPVEPAPPAVPPDSQIQDQLLCPITMDLMTDPVIVTQCGHTFEKEAITQSIRANPICPLCRKKTTLSSLVPNYHLKNVIQHHVDRKKLIK